MKKVLALFFLWGAVSILCPPLPIGEGSQIIEIPRGASVKNIVSNLKKEHFLWKGFPYSIFVRMLSLKAGEYELSYGKSPIFILKKIEKGLVKVYNVTFPEGMNQFEMAELLDSKNLISKEEFLKLSHDEAFIMELLGEKLESLEGYLYPNTYKITKGMGARPLIREMTNQFLKMYEGLDKTKNKTKTLSRHEAATLASIIEKETGQAGERRLISSVFWNRLNKNFRLESDPTIIYGFLKKTGRPLKDIKRRHILEKTAYNTYKIGGLPPGPIANAGGRAFEAVFNPLNSDFYFFVSQNDGSHFFSKTFEEHKKAVDRFQRQKKR